MVKLVAVLRTAVSGSKLQRGHISAIAAVAHRLDRIVRVLLAQLLLLLLLLSSTCTIGNYASVGGGRGRLQALMARRLKVV